MKTKSMLLTIGSFLFLGIILQAGWAGKAHAQAWRFAFLADTRSGDKDGTVTHSCTCPPYLDFWNIGTTVNVLEGIAADISKNRDVDLVIVGGDLVAGVRYYYYVTKCFAYPNLRKQLVYNNDRWYFLFCKPAYKHHYGWMYVANQLFYNEKQQKNVPVYPIRGNHEAYESEGEVPPQTSFIAWFDFVQALVSKVEWPQFIHFDSSPTGKGLSYYFDYNNARFLLLDNYLVEKRIQIKEGHRTGEYMYNYGYDTRVNQPFVDEALTAAEDSPPHVFVVGHAPAVGFSGLDSDDGTTLNERDAFWESLAKSRARMYLTAHVHAYNRARFWASGESESLWQVVVGNGTKQLNPWGKESTSPYGYTNMGDADHVKYEVSYSSIRGDPEDGNTGGVGYTIVDVEDNKVTVSYYRAEYKTSAYTDSDWHLYDQFSYTLDSEPTTEISIDIKPGSKTNPINLKSKGVLRVTILGAESFDNTEVDPSTLFLTWRGIALTSGGDNGVSPLLHTYQDVNNDGLSDMVLKFSMKDLNPLNITQVPSGELMVTLIGETYDGTRLEGQDLVRIVNTAKDQPE